MNQAIQFPDREEWDPEKQCITFPALVHGMQLTCAIGSVTLENALVEKSQLSGWLHFREHRWDLEEEADEMICNQQEDDQGWVWFS
nr:Protein of uncharacterised function (DUF1488) [Raoultella sp. NCTC 9187]